MKIAGRRVLRLLVYLLFVILVLVTGFNLIANLRGGAAWKRAQARLADEGETFTLEELYPSRIPDEENFFATPALDGIASEEAGVDQRERLEGMDLLAMGRRSGELGWSPISYRGRQYGIAVDFARWLERVSADASLVVEKEGRGTAAQRFGAAIDVKCGDLLAELADAAKRPSAQILPTLFERTDFDRPTFSASEHFGPLIDLARVVQLRGIVAARKGELELFLSNLNILYKLAAGYRREPTFMSQSGADTIEFYAADIIWEVCNQGILTDALLDAIEEFYAGSSLRRRWLDCVRGEFIHSQAAVDAFGDSWQDMALAIGPEWLSTDLGSLAGKLAPAGWWNQNRKTVNEWYLENLILPAKNDSWIEVIRAARKLDMTLKGLAETKHPHRAVAVSVTVPIWEPFVVQFVRAEALRAQVLTSCALEKHRLRTGEYPDALVALSGGSATAVRNDPFSASGDSLRYRREGEWFRLWSIGENGRDDDGVVRKDLIWRFGGVLPPEPPVEPWTPRPKRKKRR